MNENQPSLLREVTGSVIGALMAATSSALVFLWFFDLPTEPNPRNHTGTALAMVILVMLICGGFIGHRGFIADALSDLIRPVVGSYLTVILLCLIVELELDATAVMVGLASVGILSSAVASLGLMACFPPKEPAGVAPPEERARAAHLASGRPWKW